MFSCEYILHVVRTPKYKKLNPPRRSNFAFKNAVSEHVMML